LFLKHGKSGKNLFVENWGTVPIFAAATIRKQCLLLRNPSPKLHASMELWDPPPKVSCKQEALAPAFIL
jgi:hypothetical protein